MSLDLFSDEDRKRFGDPEHYAKFRIELESDINVCIHHYQATSPHLVVVGA